MTPEELAGRVAKVRQELAEAAEGRYPVPRLIAVTKTHSAEEILPLAEAGVTEIGENRVQELKGKLPDLHRGTGRQRVQPVRSGEGPVYAGQYARCGGGRRGLPVLYPGECD